MTTKEVRGGAGGLKAMAEAGFEIVGDCVIARLDQTVVMRRWCPPNLEHLQEPPADRDDAVAVLRWSLAWRLDICRLAKISRITRVPADRIMAFMEAPARRAGDLLTFAEAARLMREMEERIEDRELADEAARYSRLAVPFIEIFGCDYGKAVRFAKHARKRYRQTGAVPTCS